MNYKEWRELFMEKLGFVEYDISTYPDWEDILKELYNKARDDTK